MRAPSNAEPGPGAVPVPAPIPGNLTLYHLATEGGASQAVALPDGRWLVVDLRSGDLVPALRRLAVRTLDLLVDTGAHPGREYAGKFDVGAWWRPDEGRIRHWAPVGADYVVTALPAGGTQAVAVRWGAITVLIGGEVDAPVGAGGRERVDAGWLGLCHNAFAAGLLDLVLAPLVVSIGRGFSPVAWRLHAETGPVPLALAAGPTPAEAARSGGLIDRLAVAGVRPDGGDALRDAGWRPAGLGERPGAWIAVDVAPDGRLEIVPGEHAALLRRPRR